MLQIHRCIQCHDQVHPVYWCLTCDEAVDAYLRPYKPAIGDIVAFVDDETKTWSKARIVSLGAAQIRIAVGQILHWIDPDRIVFVHRCTHTRGGITQNDQTAPRPPGAPG